MAKDTCKPNQWKIYGRHLRSSAKPNFKTGDIKPGDIVIEEQISCLTMGPQPFPGRGDPSAQKPANIEVEPQNEFGVPISADLAVRLISLAYSKGLEAQDFLKGLLDKESHDIDQLGFINDVIGLNYGITFDKTITLKILGQPNCEGLRCYLCKRPDNYKAPFTGDESHISLVLVGVDSQGFDLNYSSTANLVAGVKTQSLVAEYGYPPTGKSLELKGMDPHYTLLNYAHPQKKGS